MRVVVEKDYEAMSRCATDLVQKAIEKDPQCLVSFPGGDTPVGMLREFVSRVNSGMIDPTGVKFVQLDDWVGIGPQDEGSCSHFVNTQLLTPMHRPFADKFLFDGSRIAAIDCQLKEQDAFIRRYGPIAVEVLGIGMNGHLGFNENGVDFSLRSHRTPLSAVTKAVQKKYFGGRELPLAEGITQGIAQIMESELVILLASGVQKAEIRKEYSKQAPVENHRSLFSQSNFGGLWKASRFPPEKADDRRRHSGDSSLRRNAPPVLPPKEHYRHFPRKYIKRRQ